MNKQNKKSIIAWIAMLATVLVLFFSATYLAEHVDHACREDNCSVCEVMGQCSNNLKALGTAMILVCTGLFFLVPICTENHSTWYGVLCNSLISQKVRMNN